jgi:hypothetical protein
MPGNNAAVRLDVERPQTYNRLTVLLRMFVIVPHAIVFFFIGGAQVVVTLLAWGLILFTGRYPEGLYNFSLGVTRWCVRLLAYIHLLTDDYPPLSPEDEFIGDTTAEPARSVTVSRTA